MSQKSYQAEATLYLIPTPIGNMQDMTLRSIEILKQVEVIFSEDTRITSLLLNQLGIKKKLISSHKFNEEKNVQKLLSYLEKGCQVGLVSDRGTPIISDPGYALARSAIEKGYSVVGLPGATALIPALIMSGLSPQPFLFYGFLNAKDSKRKQELEELKFEKATMIFYEAPHRLIDTLEVMEETLGNRNISISREISKKFEEVYRGTIEEVKEEVKDAKGEFVLVVDGNHEEKNYNHLTVIEHVNLYLKEGKDLKEAMKLVASDRGIKKGDVYKIYHTEER